jgi:hypothetical protein
VSVNPREGMILSLLVPPSAKVAADDITRLSAQFGVPPERVQAMTERVLAAIRSAGSNLDACQPKGARRCPHCAGVLP